VIDSKNFNGLSGVFTDDAVANYGPPLGILYGLPAIIASLDYNLENFTTQHSLTTQTIDILANGTADTVTYVNAIHFGVNGTIYGGEYARAWARYEDQMRVGDDGVWRIIRG